MTRAVLLIVAAACACAAFSGRAAAAPDGDGRPWAGGHEAVSATERRLGEITSEISRRPGSVAYCNSPSQWKQAARGLGFHPSRLFGFVPTVDGIPANHVMLANWVCTRLDRFLARPRRVGQKLCRTRRHGRYRDCASYRATIESIETVAHEAVHVAGVTDEPAAECFGVQLTPFAAFRLGATPQFALEIGRDYLPVYRRFTRVNPKYRTRQCHDGGPLDLWPEQRGWPAPRAQALTVPPLVTGG